MIRNNGAVQRRVYYRPANLSVNDSAVAHGLFSLGLRTDEIANKLKKSEAEVANALSRYRELLRMGFAL